MTQPRFRAVSLLLRAALLVLLTATPAAPAFSFAASAPVAGDDDLGLDIGPVYSSDEALFTFLYNASSYGEMQPCPT